MMKLFNSIIFLLLSFGIVIQTNALDITDKVESYLFDKYDLNKELVEVEFLNEPFSNLEEKNIKFKFRPLSDKEPRGLFTLLAEVNSNGNLIKRAQVRLRVKHYKNVIVAQKKLRRHQTIESDDVLLQRMDITSLREQPLDSFDNLTGFRMKRNLGQGKILTSSAIELVPDIEVGQEVTIIFNNDLLAISVLGRSMQSGSVGDPIKVKNKQSGKIIVATVMDNQSVSVGSIKK